MKSERAPSGSSSPGRSKRACCSAAACARLGGRLARVLDRQPGGDHDRLLRAAELVRLQHHPPEARVDRQLRELAPERREAVSRAGGIGVPLAGSSAPSSRSSATPSRTWRASGGSRNGKSSTSPSSSAAICRITDASEVRRISGSVKRGRVVEVVLVVEADADAVRGAPAAALALVGARLRDRLDRQPLHLQPRRVARHARGRPGRPRCRSPAPSATSPRRSSRARRGGASGPGRPSAARRARAARTAAGSRRRLSSRPPSSSAVSRISRSPERNTSTSPGPSRSSSLTASGIASSRSCSASGTGR